VPVQADKSVCPTKQFNRDGALGFTHRPVASAVAVHSPERQSPLDWFNNKGPFDPSDIIVRVIPSCRAYPAEFLTVGTGNG